MRLTLRTLLAYLDDTLEPQDREVLRDKLERSGQATQLVKAIKICITNPSLSAPAPDSVHPIEDANMMSDYLDSTLSPEQVAELEKACLDSLPSLGEAGACHQILTMVLGRPAKASDELKNRIFSMVDVSGNITPSEGRLFADGESSSAAIAGEIGPRYSGVDLAGPATPPQPAGLESPAVTGATSVSEDIAAPNELGSLDSAALESLPPSAETDLSSIDVSPDALTNIPANLPEQATQLPGEVQPVGVGDSGVFQAATKLREQSIQFAQAGNFMDDGSPMAGDRPLRELERSDFYEGDVRPSRITPWLVSLALVGVLLFAISQVFAPLVGPQASKTSDDENMSDVISADTDAPESVSPTTETETDPAESPSIPSPTDQAPPVPVDRDVDESVPPVPSSLAEAPSSDESPSPVETETMADAPPVPPSDVPPVPAGDSPDPNAPPIPIPSQTPDVITAETPDASVAMADVRSPTDASSPAIEPPVPDPTTVAPDATEDPADATKIPIATLKSDNALVGVLFKNDWVLLPPDATISTGQTIVCGPEYRAAFQIGETEGRNLTMVGPSEVTWKNKAPLTIEARFGKGLIELGLAGDSVVLQVGGIALVATAESGPVTFGYEIIHRRPIGLDPLISTNHQTALQLVGLSGDVSVTGQAAVDTADGATGGDCIVPGAFVLSEENAVTLTLCDESTAEPKPEVVEAMPTWVDAEVDTGSLEAQAASDLLELVRGENSDSLLLSLRVALGFRRNEVAALAGKTMLAFGDATAFFGVDGLFSVGKQRLYWSSHLDAVRDVIARGAEDAAAVRTSIAGQNEAIDNADGDTIFRLLVGYSQDQLKTGGDAELVNDLESASVPVRVLASENLRDISGTTLFFRPEEIVQSRRDEVIKKWKVRLKKESIRYPETE
ncbi:hypothetical protein U8335_21600 [Roseiconus lacunae]|uniref:hypothetical protein n=1 Tax=Roseiconus lacunae TaxID=2605694 RepID=UPI0030897EA9|nr:hypothetical protein U8335_21600 [Stieleria sp. HD01]